jgi:delta8-fatty-acid desaturase
MKKEDENVFEFQLRTTLDVDCPKWMDWVHGGLQFQALHHMFPRLPRHRLRDIQPMVQALCDKHGIKYHRYKFIEANILTLQHMHRVAMASRNGKIINVEDSLLFHGFNAIG